MKKFGLFCACVAFFLWCGCNGKTDDKKDDTKVTTTAAPNTPESDRQAAIAALSLEEACERAAAFGDRLKVGEAQVILEARAEVEKHRACWTRAGQRELLPALLQYQAVIDKIIAGHQSTN